MAKEQAGFRTSMFGFHKTDVLACIDRMSAENLASQERSAAQVASLQESLDVMRSEKEGFEKQAKEKERALSVAQRALVEQTTIAGEATARVSALTQALKVAEASAHDYKSRLFTREGEATVLRRDNARLTQSLSEKQQEIQQAEEQVVTVQKATTQEIATVRSAAAKEVAVEQQRLQQEQVIVQDQMKASAENMAQDVVALKQALADLDQKIGDSLRDLQHSSAMLSKTLETAEDSARNLGVKFAQFPEIPSVGVAPKSALLCTTKPVKRCAVQKSKTQSISALLLTQIAKMIGEE